MRLPPRQMLTCQPHLCCPGQVEIFEAGGVDIVNLGWIGIWCHSTAFLGDGRRGQVTLASLFWGVTPEVPLEASRIALSSPIMADSHDPAQGSLLRQRWPGFQALLTNTAPRKRSGTVMGVKPCKRGGVSEAQKPESKPEEGGRGCPATCSPPHSRGYS